MIEEEDANNLFVKLAKLSEEDEELGMVVMCIEDGIAANRQIAKETGFEIKKVNNLKKKLKRRLERLDPFSERKSE